MRVSLCTGAPVELVPSRVLGLLVRLPDALALRVGNSDAPEISACASAWRMRAVAARMSKLAVLARSISPFSSSEPKLRHQSGATWAAALAWSLSRQACGTSIVGRL